jgi:hypothetical protein
MISLQHQLSLRSLSQEILEDKVTSGDCTHRVQIRKKCRTSPSASASRDPISGCASPFEIRIYVCACIKKVKTSLPNPSRHDRTASHHQQRQLIRACHSLARTVELRMTGRVINDSTVITLNSSNTCPRGSRQYLVVTGSCQFNTSLSTSCGGRSYSIHASEWRGNFKMTSIA